MERDELIISYFYLISRRICDTKNGTLWCTEFRFCNVNAKKLEKLHEKSIDQNLPQRFCVCVKSHTFNKSVQSIRIKNNQVRKCLAKAKAKIIDLICLVRLPQVNLPIRTFHSTTARERSFVELYQLRSKLWISFEWNEYEYNGRVSMNSWTKNHHFVKRIQWKQWQN